MSDDRIKAATASWERYFDVHYPHSVDDLSPADYFLDWDRLFLGHGVDLVGERPPVVAIHARALIDKFTHEKRQTSMAIANNSPPFSAISRKCS